MAGGIVVSEADNDDDKEEEEVMEDGEENQDEGNDWRIFFGEPSPDDATSVHSLTLHCAVFLRAWMTLLPRLTAQNDTSTSKEIVVRALNVMHRGVLSRLT